LTVTLTRSPLVIAGVTAANRAGAAIAALPAGMLADRMDRRRMMVVCNVISGVALTGLVAAMTLGRADLVMVYLVAVVIAVCDVAYTLALQGSVPDVVPAPDQLGLGNGRLVAVEGAGEQLVGPGVGGLLFSFAQRLPFVGDAASFFISAVLVRASLSRYRRPARHAAAPAAVTANGPAPAAVTANGPAPAAVTANGPAPAPTTANGPAPAAVTANGPAPGAVGRSRGATRRRSERGRHRSGLGADFRRGLELFSQQRPLKLLAATVAALAFSQNMVFALLVVYGTRTLHLGNTGYGVFLAAASLIGVVGAFSGGRLQRRFGPGRLIVGGLVLATLSYVGLSFTRSAVLAVFVLGLQEVGTAVSNVGSVTTRQRLIPRSLFGRVGGVHRLAVAVAAPAGALLGGLIASIYDVPVAMLTAGLLLAAPLAYLGPALLRDLADLAP
jgi:predicted MFS family arabinose efflux permease